MNTKTKIYKTAAFLIIMMMLFAAMPVAPAAAVSLDITSVATGNWEATAWPDTLRSGTITVTTGVQTVTGSGTAFLTELSIGNKLKTTTGIMIGTVASIASDTELTLSNIPATTRTDIAYHVQGVGPADNAIIADTHTVTIAAETVNQTGTVTVNSGGTLSVSNPSTIFSTLTVNGTVSATDDIAFGELIVKNGGVLDAGGNGTYTASSLTINSGGTVTLTRELTVDSATIISGTINFGSASVTSRAMTFLGPVTLNSGATWNEPASGNGSNNSYTFFGNFTNNAAVFSASSAAATHSFGGIGKTISGSTETAIAKVDVSGTYTNNGILTVGSALSGTGALTNSTGKTLNLGGSVSITTLANAGTLTKTGAGSISTALANFANTGTINLDSTGTISGGITNNAGGIVNILSSGAITAFDNATATSVLNISDLTPPAFSTLTVTAPGNTVNYNGNGDQTVKSITYDNLVFSGSGNKSITMASGSTLTTGNLSIAPTGTAMASLTGQNLAVNSLALGGFGKINGTWGSTASAATNQDDNFFALTNGYLNVATDSRLAQTISFTSSAPTNAGVGGPTYTPTATATSGLPVVFTIDASASSVCSISAGAVSFNANGTCIINANQAGNATYQAAPQAQQSFTVKTNQTISFTSSAPTNAVVGGPTYTPTATATSGLPVVFTIAPSSSSVCSISAGAVSFQTAGTCVIRANQAGNATFNPAPQVLQSFPVSFQETNVHVTIGTTEPTGSPFTLVQGTSARKTYAGLDKGPVKIESVSPAAKIIASERMIFKANGVNTSFSEMMGLPNNQLHNVYWLPWYNNTTMNTHLRIANVSATTATVRVFIAGQLMPGSPFTVAKGTSINKIYLGINQGPVRIVSNVNIIASERVIYKVNNVNTSFSEMMALPENRLNKVYWMPWYTNNPNVNTQLQISNVSTSPATVRVFIGGQLMPGGAFALPGGASVSKTYAGINKGPVKIVSTVNIIASERTIYKVNGVNTSFSETMGLPNSQLDTRYWLPRATKNLAIDNQLRVANASASPATVHVYIGGIEMAGSPFTLAVGASKPLNFPGIDKGPVQIVSNVKIVAGVRVIYKVNGKATSYSELTALPNKLLDSKYWMLWYNNKTMRTELLFGMP